MQFVIFHGAFGYPEENWIPQLKESLEALGQEVIVPVFPCDEWEDITKAGPTKKNKHQTLPNWLKVFEEDVLPKLGAEKVCFVGHSLSPLFILHLADRYDLNIDCAIFVSPFLRDIEREDLWQFRVVNESFFDPGFDFEKLRKKILESYVLYSETDPYVSTKFFLEFGQKMNSSIIRVKGGGHLSASVNLNEFPLVYELCKSRLDLSLYQKYVAHRRELYGVDYIKPSEEVIYLKPKEFFDEGIFKFRNLKTHGFCTFFTSLKIWDTQSIYMQSCRNAAKRMGDITRVFVVDKLSDLERPKLKEQVELDINSELKIYFVMKQDVKDITPNLDFGVWDYEYLCVVEEDEASLSSRAKEIELGKKWEEAILQKATRVKNVEQDLQAFILRHSNK